MRWPALGLGFEAKLPPYQRRRRGRRAPTQCPPQRRHSLGTPQRSTPPPRRRRAGSRPVRKRRAAAHRKGPSPLPAAAVSGPPFRGRIPLPRATGKTTRRPHRGTVVGATEGRLRGGALWKTGQRRRRQAAAAAAEAAPRGHRGRARWLLGVCCRRVAQHQAERPAAAVAAAAAFVMVPTLAYRLHGHPGGRRWAWSSQPPPAGHPPDGPPGGGRPPRRRAPSGRP